MSNGTPSTTLAPAAWPPPLLLRPAEAAKALGISRSRVYELLAAGELPSIRIGGSVRVPVAALERWIAERTDSSV